jgi:thiamine biosynthesis protein ThiI
MKLPDLACNALACRYNEIATKGANRGFFEGLLVRGIKSHLRGIGRLYSTREKGRIFLFKRDNAPFSPADLELIRREAPRIAGLSSISPGCLLEPKVTLERIEDAVSASFAAVYAAFCAADPSGGPVRYRMRANRASKWFPMTSNDLEIHITDCLLPLYPRLKVDLKHPDFTLGVDLRLDGRAFIFYERIEGPGGLPASSAGRMLALLSGGIDSPVACHQMMMRGTSLDYVTFHSAPYTPPGLVRKVAGIVDVLNLSQEDGRFYAVNMGEAQKAFRDHCESRLRTILYRRLMVRIAAVIARFRQAEGLVTGENLGQVASQTLPNLSVIGRATTLMILRPLIAWNKQDTMELARQIGTYDLSCEPIPDSCTVFMPDHPATATTVAEIEVEEAKVDLPALLRRCLEETVEVAPGSLETRPEPGLMTVLDVCLREGF